MNFADVHKIALVAALIAALLLFQGALDGWRALDARTARQRHETAILNRWLTQRDQLAPVTGRWRETYPSAAEIQDLADLYRALRVQHLTVDPDTLQIEQIRAERGAGQPLGVSRFCVRSAGAAGLNATAKTVADALDGVDALARRPDVRIGRVTLDLHDGRPRLLLGGFCVIMRNDDTAGPR